MFALLSRAASVADNGGPLARPLFGEKRKRRGEMDGEIKRRGRGETIFEKERKEGRGWHESRAGQVHARIGHNEANQPAKCTHNRQQTVYYIRRETVAKTDDLYLSFFLSLSCREICRAGLRGRCVPSLSFPRSFSLSLRSVAE